MVVAPRRDERRLIAHSCLFLEPEDVPPEGERTVEICHFQVDVSDIDAWVDSHGPTIAS